MKYLLLLHNDENAWEAMPEAERNEVFGTYMAYTDDIIKSGHHIAGAPLDHSRDGKRVRAPAGEAIVEDGPFSDGKEQLGGFYLIDAANLDEALDLAARCPCASHGWVEVRPLWDIPSA